MLLRIAVGPRILLCRQISRYDGQPVVLRIGDRILLKRAAMRGVIVLDDPKLVEAADKDFGGRLLGATELSKKLSKV